jgi:predicted P-loop ATPase
VIEASEHPTPGERAPIAPQPDHDAIRTHVRMLHTLAKAAGVDGILVLTRIDAKTEKLNTERFAIGDDKSMSDAVIGWSGNLNLNLYASFAIFRKDMPRGARGGEADGLAVLALVGDLDSDKGKTSVAITDLPLEVPYVIETSPGNFQPFWPLSRALSFKEAKPVAELLGDTLGGDGGTKDTCHVWRIPGTLNWPNEAKLKRGRSPIPHLVTVVTPWEGDLIDLDDIEEAIWTPAGKGNGHAPHAFDDSPVEFTIEAFDDLPPIVQERIAMAAPDADRSRTAASVMWSLFKRGWSNDAVEEVIAAHPDGIGARYTRKGKSLGKDIKRLRKKWDKRSIIDAEGLEGPQGNSEIEIARLARLNKVAYDQEREAAAAKLGVRKPVLDDLVKAQRKKNDDDERKIIYLQKRKEAGEPEWRERYLDGKPRPSMHNARLAITALGVDCSYDTFHNKILFGYADDKTRHTVETILGEVTDNGIIALRQLMSDKFGFDLEDKATRDAVKSLALEHCFNPVADMLDKAEAEWDGVERLDHMAAEYLNCEDTPLNRACVRKTMIAAVARVRQPGIKFDTILVLESPEGFNKSTAWRLLAGDDNFSDEAIIGKQSREVQEHLAAVWVHENAELAGMKKAELETVKAFASRQVDRARPAFGHFLKQQPRHSIEVGTTNSDEYHQSQTGNRRFWGMKVLKSIDLKKLSEDRLLLWGEAAHYQSKGECLTIDEAMWPDAAAEQEKRRVKDAWEDILVDMPELKESHRWDEGQHQYVRSLRRIIHIEDGQERVASETILTHVLEIEKGQQGQQHTMRLSNVMQRLGWQRNDGNKITINGKRVRGYFRPVPPCDQGIAGDDERPT